MVWSVKMFEGSNQTLVLIDVWRESGREVTMVVLGRTAHKLAGTSFTCVTDPTRRQRSHSVPTSDL